MFFQIRHTLRYTYDRPVFLEPITVRLQPRGDAHQHVQQYSLTMEPAPAGRTAMVEHDGHTGTYLWFDGLHAGLTVTSTAMVRVERDNPFDFVLLGEAARLPLCYTDAALHATLAPYLYRPGRDNDVDALARELVRAADGDATRFLVTLTDQLRSTIRVFVREGNGPWPAAQTLRDKCGACRDVAVLMMDVCRSVGIAARFVSGYAAQAGDDNERHLHAWVEVYLPGGGWRGFDPSLGLAVAGEHVVLAAAADPALAAPVTGTFRGTGATAQMQYDLDIQLQR